MGSVILNFSTRGVQLCRWMSLLGFYDVQRTKAGVVAVSLGVEQILSPHHTSSSPHLLLLIRLYTSFLGRTYWLNGV